jgi:polyphosphate kinase 2 (PPK2 family)
MISITCLSVVSAYKQRGPTNRLQERLKHPSKNRKPSENDTNDRRFWGKYMEVYGRALTLQYKMDTMIYYTCKQKVV